MGARRELVAAVTERYRQSGRVERGRILDELTAVTGWHRKHAIRALAGSTFEPRSRCGPRRLYTEPVRDALIALWEASDRICGKRLKAMIPALLPALEHHGRLKLAERDRALVLGISAATIDRMLAEVRMAAHGGRRRRAGFSSAVRREVPVRTFNDWNDPPPGFCEVDLVAHGGMSVTGAFIQTLTRSTSPPAGQNASRCSYVRERLLCRQSSGLRPCSLGRSAAWTSTTTAHS